MRLSFNILCFEDDRDFLDPIIEALEDHLETQGFYLRNKGIYKDSGELDKTINKINAKTLDVDLILMDYRLANNEKGDELIGRIRKHELLTDIIFYSQHPAFKQEIRPLDGVYITGRRDLRPKLFAVTDHILRKTLDLSNLRGLVMTETSELEDLMIQIILNFLEKDFFNEPTKEKQTIKKRVQKSFEKRLRSLDKIKIDGKSAGDTRQLISSLRDSSLRARTLMQLIKNFIKEQNNGGTNLKYLEKAAKLARSPFVHEDFEREVLEIRNKLAHVKESTNEKGHKVLKSTGGSIDEFLFDEKKAMGIRKNLKRYYELLTGIYETISGKKWD
jgi:CheY-like chemotaxis protein